MLVAGSIQDEKHKIQSGFWSKKVIGGRSVTIRPVESRDVGLIHEMHDRLSADSIYLRYLGFNKPSIEELQIICSSGCEGVRVFVAAIEGEREKVIALAYYQVDQADNGTAEPAVLVEDQYQGCGLGKAIMKSLFFDAISQGIEYFHIVIHPTNFRVLNMIKKSGLDFKSSYSDGFREVRLQLA